MSSKSETINGISHWLDVVFETIADKDSDEYIESVLSINKRTSKVLENARKWKIPRLPWDAYFLLLAELVATRSTCDRGPNLFFDLGRHGVGVVIAVEERIIATGYNGSPPGEPHCDDEGHLIRSESCVRSLHAEENALLQCALDGVSPRGGTIYTTAFPCWDCAKRLVRVGIERIVYGTAYESRHGMSGETLNLLQRADVTLERLDFSEYLEGVKR